MARQQRSKAAPSRQSRRIQAKTAAAAESYRVRKHAKSAKRNERKKRNKARGADALRRQQAGDMMCDSCQLRAEVYRAAHPGTTRSGEGPAAATPPTRDAATSTDDLIPATIDLTPSVGEITPVNAAPEGRYVPRIVDRVENATPEERARIMWARKMFVLEKWSGLWFFRSRPCASTNGAPAQ